MLSNDKKQEILNKICSSKTFSNAPTSIALLKYLFEATLSETDLKESVIELEFFGDKKLKKDNPKVRVNVYNLRKKLAQYYETEGASDEYIIIIEKGQYLLQFDKSRNGNLFVQKLSFDKLLPYSVIAVLSVVIIVLTIPAAKPKIWKSFLNNKKQTTLYVGDAFGMIGETITGNTGWTRDYNINNTTDYYELVENNPQLRNKLDLPPYTYTTQMAVMAAKEMQKLFGNYRNDFAIRYSSKTTIDEIKEGNCVYVGPIKNNNLFIRFFNEANKYFRLSDSSLHLINCPNYNDTVYSFPYRVSNEEYAIVSKIPGPDNTTHLLFFSNHDIGVSATFRYFTDIEYLSDFENKYLSDYKYFTALYKAKGVNRSDINLELVMVVPFFR